MYSHYVLPSTKAISLSYSVDYFLLDAVYWTDNKQLI
jgi:hypothetical protein